MNICQPDPKLTNLAKHCHCFNLILFDKEGATCEKADEKNLEKIRIASYRHVHTKPLYTACFT